MPYLCPICQLHLNQHQESKGYCCDNKHHFDLAKEGYLNLLPAQYKKSKEPGDSRAMMRARRHFLESGYYQALAQAIAKLVDKHRDQDSTTHILDTGCGEGYYCRQIQSICKNSENLDLHGIDIAKNAILAAAKKQALARFVVASTKRMPYSDEFFDFALQVYAPSNTRELKRVITKNGFLLTVTPGPRHLWQLKEFIYNDVKEHDIDALLPDGFAQVETKQLAYKIQPDQEQRMALLQMTPFAWRANRKTKGNILKAKDLEIETDFILTLLKKEH